MAPDKKDAIRLGAHIAFIDESGFFLIAPIRKTWGPRWQTLIVRHQQKHDRISIISTLTISPTRIRFGLYYSLHEKNIQRADVCRFLRDLLNHPRGSVIGLWDNALIHKGEAIRTLCSRYRRLHLEPLPPYGRELNPNERVWSQAKYSMANGRPDTIDELWCQLIGSLEGLKASQKTCALASINRIILFLIRQLLYLCRYHYLFRNITQTLFPSGHSRSHFVRLTSRHLLPYTTSILNMRASS